jgi:hypothetical protein
MSVLVIFSKYVTSSLSQGEYNSEFSPKGVYQLILFPRSLMFVLFHKYANLADYRNILTSRLKLGVLMLLFGVITSLMIPLDGQPTLITQTTEAYNGGDSGSVYDKSSISDATFDTTIEKLGCAENYNKGIELQYNTVSASLPDSIVELGDGTFHIKQSAATCENDDDDDNGSNAHYEDVLKKRKKKRR